MNRLSDRINALAPSATLAMSQKSSELRAQGVDVINLSVGEPDFFTPDHIKAAAKQAIDDNFSFYSPVPGYLSLRQAVCEKLRRENGLEYTPDQIRLVFEDHKIPTSVLDVTADEKAVKRIMNGHLVIIREGVMYNAQGTRLN